MPLIVDRYNETVVFYPFRPNHAKGKKISRRVWYNKKNPRSKKLIKTAIRFLHETKEKNEQTYFITITTKQHENGFSDKQLYHSVYLWLKNKQIDYISVCERQQYTGDLHFHIVARTKEPFNITYAVKYFAKRFNVQYHPALFDVKKLRNASTLRSYITKYFTKQQKYSSLFTCRTFSIANRFRKKLIQGLKHYVVRANDDYVLKVWHRLTKTKIVNEYCTLFKYSLHLWKHALDFVRTFDKAGFKPLTI